jgi:hypothetical protein
MFCYISLCAFTLSLHLLVTKLIVIILFVSLFTMSIIVVKKGRIVVAIDDLDCEVWNVTFEA